jgi:hypothetical protein
VDGIFFRPQLVVVSGLFGGNPFVDGIFLGHNLLLSQASFFTVELRLSRFFFIMKFWLSRSVSHEFFFFFHDGISAITKPFSRIFLFSHDGILAITKPFS